MNGAGGRSGPAVGILNGLVICAGLYGLLGVTVLLGGLSALLLSLLLAVGLLHGCLTGTAHRTSATDAPPVTSKRSALA